MKGLNTDIAPFNRIDVIATLAGFNWVLSSYNDKEQIRMGYDLIPKKLQLRVLTEEEKKRISTDFSSTAKPLEFEKNDVTVLELKDTSYSNLIKPYYNLLEKALLSFRLYKVGNIFIDSIYPTLHTPSIGEQDVLPIRQLPEVTPYYELSPEEIDGLLNILNKLESTDFENNHTLRIACKRFENSYHTYSIEDTLIDLMIGFEALFVYGRKGNKGHLIGERCSEKIKNDKTEENVIYHQLKESYCIRNNILHGSPFNISDVFQRLTSLEDYLRRSILQFLP